MIILPDCEIKLLSECETGKLVRLVGHMGKGEFALVADLKHAKDRALVLFQEGMPAYVVQKKSRTAQGSGLQRQRDF